MLESINTPAFSLYRLGRRVGIMNLDSGHMHNNTSIEDDLRYASMNPPRYWFPCLHACAYLNLDLSYN